jgi:uncharacterized phage protein gp47/JayE
MTQTINFTGRDFSAEYERLLALLKIELPEYTDWNHSDAGITLLRLLARETDLLNDYIDLVFNEGFLQTAQFRQSLVELGRLVDYLPEISSAATTQLSIVREYGSNAPEDTITLPKYTSFARNDGLNYLSLDALTIPYTQTPYTVNAIQGTVTEVTITRASFSVVDFSGFLKYNMGAGVASGTIEMFHGEEPVTTWTQVDSFWRSRDTDCHFLTELNGDTDSVWLVVGNGTHGALPPEVDSITLRYVACDGAGGNCGAGRVTGVPVGYEDYIDTVTNTIVANGGSSSETIDSLRRQIPAVTRAQRRAVTHDDYEALVQHQPGVLWCQALDRNEVQFFPWEFVALYIVPDGGGPMNDLFKAGLLNEIGQWGHLLSWPGRYVLLDATEYPVDVTMRVWRATGYTENTVTQNITSALNTLFSLNARSIAETLSFIDLHQAVSSVAGVSVVEFVTPTSDVNPGNGNFIRPGTYTIQYQ